jgi:hypothetical protein
MTKWMQWTMAAACAGMFGVTIAAAEVPTPKNRQVEQQQRIAQGVKRGELTRVEVRRLEHGAARMHRSIRKDRRDQGVFTPLERSRAQRALNHQSRAIARQKHDRQDR